MLFFDNSCITTIATDVSVFTRPGLMGFIMLFGLNVGCFTNCQKKGEVDPNNVIGGSVNRGSLFHYVAVSKIVLSVNRRTDWG